MFYYHGFAVETDYQKAYEYIQAGLEFDDPHIIFTLGLMYESGHGVKKNRDTAIELYTKAAILGYQPSYERLTVISPSSADIVKQKMATHQ